MYSIDISDSTGLALLAINAIVKRGGRRPMKLTDLAAVLNAPVARLGEVMHRLTLAGVVASKDGSAGGFVLGRRAGTMTRRDVRGLFEAPKGCEPCVMGHGLCPFGECLLGGGIPSRETRILDL